MRQLTQQTEPNISEIQIQAELDIRLIKIIFQNPFIQISENVDLLPLT